MFSLSTERAQNFRFNGGNAEDWPLPREAQSRVQEISRVQSSQAGAHFLVADTIALFASLVELGGPTGILSKAFFRAAFSFYRSGLKRERVDARGVQAYNLYLKGRYHWNQRSERSLRKGIDYFEESIALDAKFAPAYSGLADSYSLLGNYGVLPAKKVKVKALIAAENAVAIDPTLAEAHTALGHVRATYNWDWPGARAEYQIAISLNPAYATVHHWYAVTYLAPLGFVDAALAEMEKAEELNPVSVSIKRDIAVILYTSRQYWDAVEQSKCAIELDRGFHGAYWALGISYEGLALYADAVGAFQKGLELAPDTPRLLGALGHTYGRWGKRGEAQGILERLTRLAAGGYVSPFDFALVHLGLGEWDSFFEWLELAYRSRCYELVSMRVDPKFDAVRGDARFVKMLRRLGLETGSGLASTTSVDRPAPRLGATGAPQGLVQASR